MKNEFEDYVLMAMDHWRKFLPKMWAELKAEGREIEAMHKAARLAHDKVSLLIRQGLREDEAEEIVLPELILLPPEIKTTGSKELDAEMRELGMEI